MMDLMIPFSSSIVWVFMEESQEVCVQRHPRRVWVCSITSFGSSVVSGGV